MNKKFKKTIFFSILVLIISITSLPLLTKNINYGLDLEGGFEILYELKALNGEKLTKENVTSTYKSLLKRIDVLGVSEPEITIEGNNRIRVQLANVKNIDEAREILSKPVNISFRDVNDKLLLDSSVLKPNGASYTVDKYNRPAIGLKIADKDKFYKVTKELKDTNDKLMITWMDFDSKTDSYSNEKISCGNLESSNCLSAAGVNEAFSSDVIIQGNFKKEEVKQLVDLINSGSMPTKIEELSSRVVEAAFGQKALEKTAIAGMIGILLVMLFMTLNYKILGLVSSISILVYTSLVFLIFFLIGGVLTLPGIAALVLGIGMAVDANIITFERIKEELKNKSSLKEAVKNGNKHSLTTIIDANITTILVAIILFIFGESTIKGFAVMLIINIIITILIMIFITRRLIKNISDSEKYKNDFKSFIGFKEKKKNKKKIDFIKHKNKFLFVSISIIIIGISLIFTTGMNLGIDFAGGSAITIKSNETLNKKDIENDINGYNIISSKYIDQNKGLYIKIKDILNKDESKEISDTISKKYNASTEIGTISNTVKKDLIKNAINALILASIGIIIYITIRFKFSYAVGAILALLHDIFIMLALFSIFKLEVSGIFIAALLAIIGYSINDTIVSFDRIRENHNNKTKKDLKEIVNESLNQTIKRSIYTTITTSLPVITLILIGSFEIITFNIALLIGLLAGTYSSIFIASQIWLSIEKNQKNKPKKIKKDDNDEIKEMYIKGINS